MYVCLCVCMYLHVCLLPTGSEEREVLGVGSISLAKLPSCQNVKTFAVLLHRH